LSPLAGLDTRPSLILGPARTWHTSVGVAMWEQAKSRAEEVGSMVLWCDGGEGGVSGIGGGGMHEIAQTGEGSWMKTIGIEWPFRDSRTIYASIGDIPVLVLFWAVLGISRAPSMIVAIRVETIIRWIRETAQRAGTFFSRRRVIREEYPPLLG